MKKEIPQKAFLFCKVIMSILLWLAYFLKIKELVLLVFLLLLSSAILKIQKAPLVLIYSKTLEKIIPSAKIKLEERAMRFAHSLGSILAGICYLSLVLDFSFSWGLVLFFAILKTISMFGFCPGEKIYTCLKSGCCSLAKHD